MVWHNPVLGVKRPRSLNREGVTLALGDHQARMLLDAPAADTLKGQRDRTILATLLYHGLCCEELCTLQVGDIHQRAGVTHLRVGGKEDKVRYLPLFRPVKNNRTKTLAKPLHPASVVRY